MVTEGLQHKSGFVSILGEPNVGKSTLMNALVGEKMSIITRKPQTTRHRIVGIISGEDFQMVFSDTPGYVKDPAYKMHESMNRFVHQSYDDADIFLYILDSTRTFQDDHPILMHLKKTKVPVFIVLNKIDLVSELALDDLQKQIKSSIDEAQLFKISALHKTHTDQLLSAIRQSLPFGPVYYPKDQLTDRPERFFVSEIIREQILELYHDEIPYSTEVAIETFKAEESRKGPIVRIRALIFVMRKSQKAIIIGKHGSAIKELGIRSRKEIEAFLDDHVFLELHVKVKENWRDDERMLKHFGYKN
jgi:GTP-binding protein Era